MLRVYNNMVAGKPTSIEWLGLTIDDAPWLHLRYASRVLRFVVQFLNRLAVVLTSRRASAQGLFVKQQRIARSARCTSTSSWKATFDTVYPSLILFSRCSCC